MQALFHFCGKGVGHGGFFGEALPLQGGGLYGSENVVVFLRRQAGFEAEGLHGFAAWPHFAGDRHAALQGAGRESEIVGRSEAPRAGGLAELVEGN